MQMRRIPLPVCLGLALASGGHAACDPEDVAFYLDKGFTQEQITKICSVDDSGVPEYTPFQPPAVVIERPVLRRPGDRRARDARPEPAQAVMDLSGFTDPERAAVETLVDGADVLGLMVDQDSIQYTKQACLEVREDPDFPPDLKLCPEVDYRIAREGLAVGKYGREYGIFGKATVTIEGSIQRFPQQNFTDYPRKYQQKLKPHFNWSARAKTTRIPVRSGHTATQLAGALKALSRVVQPRPGEAATDTPPAQEKKKRWWNPFD